MKTKTIQQQVVTVFLLCVMSFTAYSQKAPVKFGKVNIADLEMMAYPADTSAAAAILCDYGYFSANNFQFVRVLRIKIFKKEGVHWGNRVFPVSSESDIRGITYNLENGKIVESKLKSESVFKERVTRDYFRNRVAMPNVKEGSIIDIEFRYKWLPSEWRFQEEIPVRWSELVIERSPYVTFRKIFFGFERLSENSDDRWVAKNVPAFKSEPYMNSINNYITKYEIELLNISLPPNSASSAGVYKEYSTTWEAVNTYLLNNNSFGNAMKGCPFLNSLAKDIESRYSDSVDRLKAAHEIVKKSIKWNDSESLYSSADNLGYAFNKKIGNAGDVNMILIQLLKKLDFEVYPVALSTRNRGFLSPVSPSLEKLNYVVAYVLLGDKKYFLDATEAFLPIGMLPQRCINLQGRLVDEKKSNWVDLMTDRKEKKTIQFDLKLDADNTLSGKINKINTDYAALNFRKGYEKFNSKEEYLKDLESKYMGLSIVDCTIENLDSIYLPLKESYDVKIKNQVTTSGNLIFINPLMSERLFSNPFKVETRKFPVDFIYPQEKTYVFRLMLPQGAVVTELPKSLVLKLPDGSVAAQYQVTATEGFVQLTYKFAINKPIFSSLEYDGLRNFYSELVKKHSEQIVIKTI